jgi:hypothetical protein
MKTFSAFLFMVLLGLGVASAQNTNPNALVGRAHQAVGACLGQAQQSINVQIQSRVDVVGSCFVSGFIHRVTFYFIEYGPICIPTEENPCTPALPLLSTVAVVEFDCEGNIISSECLYQ